MKKTIITVLALAAVAAALLLSSPQSVMARIIEPPKGTTPAEGSWSWNDATVTGTTIPQYQLALTNDDDYAVLQSEGIHLSGGTQLCHPYPGGQFGWNAEIRVLTSAGWQSVATVNQWVPDEEGKFMTCANVWSGGTYAVFGYWEKPADWVPTCAALPPLKGDDYWKYVSSAANFNWGSVDDIVLVFGLEEPLGGLSSTSSQGGIFFSINLAGTTGNRCSSEFWGAIETDNLVLYGIPQGPSGPALFWDHFCGCGSMYEIVYTGQLGVEGSTD